ncbi:putative TALPID3 protein-like [Apostichopus japonicus]|uniref:Putative TALPID3 protein-like n=1 Tax=Stichopus japonicus TaxID=307972 RepID=A0A2G8LQZ3_STIJA|nr:putative TALPID3 protein-like [Apostichopus japonicus]
MELRSDTKAGASASNVSETSSESSVLRKSSMANLPSESLDKSGGSLGSGSRRVKIKRKLLKERQSPFEEGERSQKKDTENIPPALPGTLPKDYEEIARRLSGSLTRQTSHMTLSPDVTSAAALHLNQRQANSGDVPSEATEEDPILSPSKKRPQSKPQTKLKQGSPNQEGFFSQDHQSLNDVRITQYAPGKRKQIIKESLSKRSEQIGPIRRVFEPQFVDGRKTKVAESSRDVNQVAVTAAAAVAATAPFVKYQHDLENKVSMILDKLHLLEAKSSQRNETTENGSTQSDGPINEALQRRLDELTSVEIEGVGEIAGHQNQVIQATHLDTHRHSNDVSRPTEQRNVLSAIEEEKSLPPHRVHSEPSVYTHRGPMEGVRNSPVNKLPMGHLQHSQTAPQREQGMVHPSRVVKQVSYAPAFKVAKGVVPDNSHGYPVRYTRKGRMTGQDEDKERTKSPLDTPAPRKHAPIPHSRSPRSKPNGGLLQEILSHQETTTPQRSHSLPSQEHRHLPAHNPTITTSRTSTSQAAEEQADRLLKEIEALRKDVSGKLEDKSKNPPGTASPISSNMALPDPSATAYFRTHPNAVTPETRKIAERELQRWQEKRLAPPPLDAYMKKHGHGPAVTSPSRQYATEMDPTKTHFVSHGGPAQPSKVISQAETLLKRVQASRMCLESNLEVVERSKKEQEFYEVVDAMYADSDSAEKTRLRQLVDDYITLVDSQVKEELTHHHPHQRHKSNIPHSPPTKLSPEKSEKVKPSAKDKVKSTKQVKKKITARIDTGLRKPKPDDEVGKVTKVTKETASSRYKDAGEKKETRKLQDKEIPIKCPGPLESYKDERYLSRIYGQSLFFQGQRSTLRDAPYLRIANQSPQTKRVKMSPSKDVNTRASQTQTGLRYTEPQVQVQQPVAGNDVTTKRRSQEEVYQRYLANADRLRDTAIPLGSPRFGGERREPLHLPPIDIDTEVSSVSEDKVISLPLLSLPLEVPSSSHSKLMHVSGYRVVDKLTIHNHDIKYESHESEEDDIPASSGVVSFQGHHDNRRREYHGPPFPPQAPPPRPPPQQPRSDDIAAHLQRRDLLEHRAVEWIEQELMAKMISEFHSRLSRPEQRPVSPEESLPHASHTVDAIGSGGVQLFVDAGQPVNSDLVAALVREISPRHKLNTPEATPPHSPIGSPPPVMHHGELQTPEPSYSDVSQENESEIPPEEPDDLLAAPGSPVGTPSTTPPPVSALSSEPGHIDTPPLSSCDSPPLLTGGMGTVGTPSLTVEETPPCSPILVEETPRLSPLPPPPLEADTTPPPTPPTETKETPLPSSESSTSSTSPDVTATETSGREISAGEWLISQQSEGQVPEVLLQGDLLGVKPVHSGVEASQTTSSDTLLETEELEKDVVQDPVEEGEIRGNANWHDISDPVVAILTRLNQLPPKTGRTVLPGDPSSPGEVSEGQRPPLAANVVNLLEDDIVSAVDGSTPQSPGEVKAGTESTMEPGEAPQMSNKDSQLAMKKSSTLRMSDLDSGSSVSKEEDENTNVDDASNDGSSLSPKDVSGVETRQAIKIAAPRVIQVGSRQPPSNETSQQEEDTGTQERHSLVRLCPHHIIDMR